MSMGSACRNNVHHAGGQWVVTDRCQNHSAFAGYHATPSAYSAIKCLECGASWRSRGKFVDRLRNATAEERVRAVVGESVCE